MSSKQMVTQFVFFARTDSLPVESVDCYTQLYYFQCKSEAKKYLDGGGIKWIRKPSSKYTSVYNKQP